VSDLVIPEIPATLTAEQAEVLRLQFSRISLLQAEEARKLNIEHEEKAAARHAALLAQHKASNGELGFAEFAAAALARENLTDEQVRQRWVRLQALTGAAPGPAAAELDAAWYLAELTEEFTSHTPPWAATLAGAAEHWILYGKPQGRKGRADGPGWGPKAKDAPPGTVL
jgi:hypothetical protein